MLGWGFFSFSPRFLFSCAQFAHDVSGYSFRPFLLITPSISGGFVPSNELMLFDVHGEMATAMFADFCLLLIVIFIGNFFDKLVELYCCFLLGNVKDFDSDYAPSEMCDVV